MPDSCRQETFSRNVYILSIDAYRASPFCTDIDKCTIEYGTPIEDADYWRQQQGANSCAVVAQICVYESLTGQSISEDDASYYAQQQGWIDPLSGTPLANTGNILNVLGIDTYQTVNTSFSDLEYALAWGDKPIVGLDANEIWNPQYDLYGNPLEQTNAGHAVWVTGIDYESDGSVGIILNDSGIPSGMASVVDYYLRLYECMARLELFCNDCR